MADNMDVTLHFNYEVDDAGFKKLMSSLDQLQERAIKTMQMQGMSQTTIDKYKNDIYTLKTAIEDSFDQGSNTWNIVDAMNLPEAQTALNNMQSIFPQTKIAVDNMGNSFESGGFKIDKYSQRIEHFKTTLANAFRYNVVNKAIDMITNSIRGMIDYVIELDSELNSIRIITGKSSEEMLQFAAANQDTAKELGRTATEYAKASLIFYQQGLDDSQVEARTNTALKLANVTGQSVQEIVNQMTAIWNNFYDGSHNLEYYEDVITVLGATTASSSKEIAAGLEKFAAIGDTVGLSYEYAASALATVVATTRQSEDVVGTAFKTMFARLQSLKLGKTLDDGTTLTKYTQALESIGISVLDQNGNLKDMDAILDEIGAKWQTLDRNQQTALANTVGGVRQYGQFIALFDNFEFFKENVNTALSSAGTVAKQNEIYMESYEARIKQIKATLDSIKFDMFMDKDFSKMLGSLDSFLVTTRVILKDFDGLNQILAVGISLMGQMFLPQIINNARLMIVRFGDELNNNQSKIEKLGSSMKLAFQSFAPVGQGKSWTEEFNKINLGQLSAIEKNRLLNQAFKDLGEIGKNQLQALIADFEYLEKQPNDFSEMLQQKILPMLKSLESTGLDPNYINKLLSTTNFSDFIDEINIINAKLKELGKDPIKLNIDETTFNKLKQEYDEIVNKADRAKKTQQQFGQGWGAFKDIQNWTKSLTAAAVAIRGIGSAIEKLQEGDKLGAVSQSLSSIGSALMMTGEAHAMGIGAALTAASTVISVIKAKMERELKEAREERDKFLEDYKNLNATSINLDNLLSTYDKLTHKIKLTTEEQEQLNNVIEQLRNILGDNSFDGVAYYTSEGAAVYYDTEKLRENTEELIRNREERLKNAEASSNKAAKSQSKDFNKDVSKLQFNNQILEYMDQVNEAQLSEEESMKMWASIMAENNIAPEDLPVMFEGKHFDQYWKELEQELRSETKNVSDNLEKDYEDIFSNMEIEIELPTLKFNSKSLEYMGSNFYQYLKDNMGKIDGLEWSPDMFDSYNEFVAKNGEILSRAMEDANAYIQAMQKLGQSTDPVLQALHHMLQQWHEDIEQNVKDQDTQIQSIYATKESLQAAMEDIEGYSESLTSLQGIYNEFNETQELTNEQISKLLELVGDNDAVRDLIELYQDGSLSLDEFNDAFSSIIDEWILSLPFLEGLTDETKNYASEMLALLGYTQDEINNILSRAELNNSINNVKREISGIKDSFFDVINSTPGLSQALIIAGLDLNAMANEAWWTKENINDLIRVTGSPTFALQTGPFAGSIKTIIGLVDKALQRINKLAKFKIKLKKTDEIEMPRGGGGAAPKGGGGGGGAEEQEYEATIDKYEKYKNQLKDIEDEIDLIEERIKNTKDPLIKNESLEEKNKKLKEHNDLLHEANEIYRADAAEAYNWLLENGFDIYYDPEKQEYTIYNWERINEVTKESTKATNEWRKEAEAQKKILEDNNKACEENSKKWRDNTQTIEENREQMLKNEMDAFNDKISDKLFYTDFYKGLQSGLPTLKNIYLDVINSLYEQLNKLYQKGYTDADDDVQKIWKEILKYQKEVDEIDNDLFNNQIKYIDRILDLIPEIPETYDERMELVQKKVELRNERINELMVKGTESALDEVMSLYEQNAKNIEAMYKLMIDKIKDQQDELKDAIDGVVILIDEEIDKLKEKQETQKKINEEKEKEIELLKLKANLEAAQQQKTVQVYRKGQGFVWEANRKAIKDAEKALNDFNSKNEKDELQEKIDALEEYKKSWSSIPQTIEDEQKKEAALLKFGANGLKEILEMRGNYQKDALEKYRSFAEQINSLTNQMNEDLETVKNQMEDVKDQQEDFINNQEVNIAEAHKIWYADSNGMAPEGAKIGDVIITAGGNRLITPEDFEGAIKSGLSGLSSILITDLVPYLYNPEKAGTEITDSLLKEQVFSDLKGIITSFSEDTLPVTTNAINDNTTNLRTMDTTIEILNTNLGIYTSAMTNAVYHGQDLVKAAGIYSSRASASADESSMHANMSYNYYKLTKDLYDRTQEQEPPEGSQNHQGIEMGPIGSIKGKQAFDSNLTRIARGDIKDDEMWALLQKGEAVFTPEQLDNMVGALNYSLDSVDKLSSLNSKMFTLGRMSNINVAPDTSNLRPISFGDINIQMHGVNDLDTFGIVLKNNVKSIFAQTLAKE